MATTSVTTDQDAIIAEIQIAAPPERVFKALCTPEELQRWFTNAECPVKSWEFDARPNGAYRYETQPGSVVVNGVTRQVGGTIYSSENYDYTESYTQDKSSDKYGADYYDYYQEHEGASPASKPDSSSSVNGSAR